ncbi:MAG: hypothetical protein KIT73_11065 [Burkholderiales bacterium]|nr:hypothetical protein [Burkholderiales bacterium]
MRGTGIGPFELNKGEVGYLDPTGTQFIRLGLVPVFLDRDRWLRDGEPDQYGCAVR